MEAMTQWLTVEEAAAHLGTTPLGIYKRVERGHIRAHRLGRLLRFKRSDLDASLDLHQASERRVRVRASRSR